MWRLRTAEGRRGATSGRQRPHREARDDIDGRVLQQPGHCTATRGREIEGGIGFEVRKAAYAWQAGSWVTAVLRRATGAAVGGQRDFRYGRDAEARHLSEVQSRFRVRMYRDMSPAVCICLSLRGGLCRSGEACGCPSGRIYYL